MFRSIFLAFLVSLFLVPTIYGQRPGNRLRDRINKQREERNDNDDDQLEEPELEGTIWEYKIIDRKTDETMSSGKIRVRESAVFDVVDVQVEDDAQNEMKKAITRRLDRIENEKVGGERIGDISFDRKKQQYTFIFDDDDKHELSGKVAVSRDNDNRGVWFGTYRQDDGTRVRFEMRELKDASQGARNDRNDVSGIVWEYKVIDRKTDKTQMVGKFRLDETGIFDVADADRDSDNPDEAIKRRIANQEAERTGDERIGDFEFNRRAKEYTLEFDSDDSHPLTGRTVLASDRDVRGLWFGTYLDEKRKRWRFEMRKVED